MTTTIIFLLGASIILMLWRMCICRSPTPTVPMRAAPTTWHSHERRRSTRCIGRPTPVTVVNLGYRVSSQRGFVMDRSAVGVRLAIAEQVAPGTMIQIRCLGADDATPWVSAVVRNGRLISDYFEVGCEFELPPVGVGGWTQFA